MYKVFGQRENTGKQILKMKVFFIFVIKVCLKLAFYTFFLDAKKVIFLMMMIEAVP